MKQRHSIQSGISSVFVCWIAVTTSASSGNLVDTVYKRILELYLSKVQI